MFDMTSLFISTAYAQDAPGGSAGAIGMNFVPLLLIFAVFYFLLIRPQQKRLDEQAKMIKALKRGDRVVTGGGIHAKVTKVFEDNENLMVEIADGVQVKVVRNTVSALAAKTEPAKADAPLTDKDLKE